MGKDEIRRTLTVRVRLPPPVKAGAQDVAAAYGLSVGGLVRELLVQIAARDSVTLAWLSEARGRS